MSAFENDGLYGQNERGHVASQVASDNRIADVESEGARKYRGVPTEQKYRELMARAVVAEIIARRQFDPKLVAELEELVTARGESAPDPTGFLVDFFARRITQESVRRQGECLQRVGRIAKHMTASGFHLGRVYTALNCALPLAFHMLRERRMDERGTIEHADRPRSRIGRSATASAAARHALAREPKAVKPGSPISRILARMTR